ELRGRRRGPDRVVRAADLRHVTEVEDRQPVPGIRNLASATFPHRPDVTLERIEIAEARWPEDRWAERQVRSSKHGVVVLVRYEAVDQLGQRLDSQAPGQMVVERRDRLAEEDAIVGQVAIGGDRPTPGDLEIDPVAP